MSQPTPPTSPPSRVRQLAVVLAILVPVVPIVIALFLSGGGGAAAVTTTQTSAFTPVSHPPVTGSTTSSTRPPATSGKSSVLPPGSGAVVGYVRHATALHATRAGRTIATLQSKTGFGSPTFVLVTKQSGRWLGVINTAAGNNHVGWVRASALMLSRVHWSLHAFLDRHLVVVYHNGRAVRHYTIAVGKPTAPTPTGHFAVTDRLNTGDPTGPYGCCILALSAKAPHQISDWDGGNRIAIHSTPETASIGHSVSHGCMRLTLAEGRWLIQHIPLGTPVDISSA